MPICDICGNEFIKKTWNQKRCGLNCQLCALARAKPHLLKKSPKLVESIQIQKLFEKETEEDIAWKAGGKVPLPLDDSSLTAAVEFNYRQSAKESQQRILDRYGIKRPDWLP